MNGTLQFKGRAHVFADPIALDGGIVPMRFVLRRERDAEKLKPHAFEAVRPGFAGLVSVGDVVVGGRGFAGGKPHPQGLMALKALGLGVICEAASYWTFRAAIGLGLGFARDWEGVTDLAADGDHLEINLETGQFHNHSAQISREFPALPRQVCAIVRAGGFREALKTQIDEGNV